MYDFQKLPHFKTHEKQEPIIEVVSVKGTLQPLLDIIGPYNSSFLISLTIFLIM